MFRDGLRQRDALGERGERRGGRESRSFVSAGDRTYAAVVTLRRTHRVQLTRDAVQDIPQHALEPRLLRLGVVDEALHLRSHLVQRLGHLLAQMRDGGSHVRQLGPQVERHVVFGVLAVRRAVRERHRTRLGHAHRAFHRGDARGQVHDAKLVVPKLRFVVGDEVQHAVESGHAGRDRHRGKDQLGRRRDGTRRGGRGRVRHRREREATPRGPRLLRCDAIFGLEKTIERFARFFFVSSRIFTSNHPPLRVRPPNKSKSKRENTSRTTHDTTRR